MIDYSWPTVSGIIQNLALTAGIVAVLGVAFFFLERIKPAEKRTPFFKKDFLNECLLALSNVGFFDPLIRMVTLLLTLFFLTPYFPYQIFDASLQQLPIVAQIFLAMLIMDFSVYWRHRFSHYALWSYHSVHHSAQQLTWLTKLRLHPIDVFAAAVFDTIFLYFLGFGGTAIATATVIMMVFDFYAHSNLNIKYPRPFRYIFASPHSHRWHHANVRAAYDKNFCAMFSIYDVVFGTFYHPEELPPVYGLSAAEQKEFPADSFLGWLAYPFRREGKRLRKIFDKSL